MRTAGVEGEAQRLARTDEVLLAHDLAERFRPQRVGQRGHGLRFAEEVVHLSPRTSAPLGGSKRNSFGLTCGLRSSLEKRRNVVCPKLSVSSIACRFSLSKPMRTLSKPASRSRGLAWIHSSPSFSPASLNSNDFSIPVPPASSAAGVEPSAALILRTVTWFNCRS